MAKLMLVEDDNNLREIYQARLQAEGYVIVSAQDGEEALVVAKAEKPDLIISDVMMPKISGFEMLDILRNTDELKNVKVIMLTALGQSDDQQRADRLGADRYLVKSQVTLEDIVKVTHELLQDAPAAAEPASEPVAPSTGTDAVAPTPPPAPAPVADEIVQAMSEPPAAPPLPPENTSTPQSTQSTAQEEANLEAKIEDFVAGATSEPTVSTVSDAPPTTSVPEAGTQSPVQVQPEPAPDVDGSPVSEPVVDEPVAAADEAQIANALDSLSSSSPSNTAADQTVSSDPVPEPTAVITPDDTPVPPTTNPTPDPDPVSPSTDSEAVTFTPDPVAPAPPETEETPESSSPVKSSVTVIAKKKVIKPLDLPSNKKDIHTLLALEEVAEKAKQATPPPPPEPVTEAAPPKISLANSSTEVTSDKPNVHIDPNSIAL